MDTLPSITRPAAGALAGTRDGVSLVLALCAGLEQA